MSTIKSSDEHLTLNADGSSKDIKLQSNGSEKVIIKSTGNVGIGETNPDASLHITSNTPIISFDESDASQEYRVGSFGGTFAIYDSTDSAYRVAVDGDGKVGIGTTSPSYRLHVETSVDGDFASLIHNTDADNGQGLMIRAGADSGEAILSLRNQASSEQFKVLANGDIYHSDYAGGKGIWAEVIANGVQTMNKCNTTGNHYHYFFQNGNGTVGNIRSSGSSTAYNTSSDYRLKENVDYTWDATTRLKQLKPARFNFIADDSVTVDGFIAHEVSDIVPEAISGEKDAMMDEEYEVTPAVEEVRDEEGNITTEAVEAVMGTRSVPDYQGIDQSKLVPLLVKTIQELEARITALEA